MAKKIQALVKLQIAAGKATPAPPVGTALGPQGVNIMDFCKNFNSRTAKDEGLIIPVVVTVYADRSYTFITKTPPAPILLKRAANIAKGSAEPNKNKVGTVTAKQVEDIAKLKMPDLNCDSLDSAIRTVAGTARSMGLDVVGYQNCELLNANCQWAIRNRQSAIHLRWESPCGLASTTEVRTCADAASSTTPHGRRSISIGSIRSKMRSRSSRK